MKNFRADCYGGKRQKFFKQNPGKILSGFLTSFLTGFLTGFLAMIWLVAWRRVEGDLGGEPGEVFPKGRKAVDSKNNKIWTFFLFAP